MVEITYFLSQGIALEDGQNKKEHFKNEIILEVLCRLGGICGEVNRCDISIQRAFIRDFR